MSDPIRQHPLSPVDPTRRKLAVLSEAQQVLDTYSQAVDDGKLLHEEDKSQPVNSALALVMRQLGADKRHAERVIIAAEKALGKLRRRLAT